MPQIQLAKGYAALVDDDQVEKVAGFPWYPIVRKSKHREYVYAACNALINGKHTLLYMHRLIMNAPAGVHVDHINGHCLDNRSVNLRLCTRAENMRNSIRPATGTSGYKGITLRKWNKWEAGIEVDGKKIYLGLFSDKLDAARAYDAAAVVHHGQFARLNFPQVQQNANQDSADVCV